MAKGVAGKCLPGTRAEDLTGQKFGKLIVVGFSRREWMKTSWRYYWNCVCEADGNPKEADGKSLKSGGVTSCGCARKDWDRKVKTVSVNNSVEKDAWVNMRTRAKNKNTKRSHRYTGRGITICERWDNSFEAFLQDMGCRPPDKTSLERKNNDKGYWCGHPDCLDCGPLGRERNCEWGTAKQQSNNQERTIWLEWKGERRCLKDWAEHLGIDYTCLWSRYSRGWSVDDILGQESGEPCHKPRPQTAVKIDYDGKSLTFREWSELTGISAKTLSSRYHWGWPPERIVTEPAKPGRRAGRDYSKPEGSDANSDDSDI
jgi:hypothetical protein